MELGTASYKEVANKLVSEFVNDKDLTSEDKEEKNIKRRVYDALNVLIASGVLIKEARKIMKNSQTNNLQT